MFYCPRLRPQEASMAGVQDADSGTFSSFSTLSLFGGHWHPNRGISGCLRTQRRGHRCGIAEGLLFYCKEELFCNYLHSFETIDWFRSYFKVQHSFEMSIAFTAENRWSSWAIKQLFLPVLKVGMSRRFFLVFLNAGFLSQKFAVSDFAHSSCQKTFCWNEIQNCIESVPRPLDSPFNVMQSMKTKQTKFTRVKYFVS